MSSLLKLIFDHRLSEAPAKNERALSTLRPRLIKAGHVTIEGRFRFGNGRSPHTASTDCSGAPYACCMRGHCHVVRRAQLSDATRPATVVAVRTHAAI